MNDNVCQITVGRPRQGSRDLLRRYRIEIDQRTVGRLKRGEEITTSVASGTHSVCAFIDWMSTETVSVELAPGENVRLLVTPGNAWNVLDLFKLHSWLRLEVDIPRRANES